MRHINITARGPGSFLGFTEDHRGELAIATGLPVILSNAVMAKLVGELLTS